MLWETFIAVRYLFRGRARRGFVVSLLVSLALVATGTALFLLRTPLAAEGVVALAVGALGAVVFGLLCLCSVFTSVSVLGVVLGVAALTVVLSVTSGFQAAFQNKILGVNAHVIVTRDEPDFYDYPQVMKEARAIPHVIGVAPFMLAEMEMAHVAPGVPYARRGILLKGVDPPDSWKVLDLPHHMVQGSLAGLDEPPGATVAANPAHPPAVVVGKQLALDLHLKLGDVVTIISPLATFQTGSNGATRAPKFRKFRVTGIFYSGFDEYDRRLAYVGMAETQALAGLGNLATGVEMKLDDPNRAAEVAKVLEGELHDPHYQVIDWRGLNHNLFTALALQKFVLTLVLALIIAVAAFNIVATMTMMVIDKTREIAILKSMGATSSGVGRLFVSVGTTIGAVGTAFGLSLGVLLCVVLRRYAYPLDPKVYLIDKLPVQMVPVEFAITAAITMGICLFASLYPASRASRLLPVDGLRYD